MKENKPKYLLYKNDPAYERINIKPKLLAFQCEFTSSGNHLHIKLK